MNTQINIRCHQSTAQDLKRLAESERLTLGAFLEKLLAGYQPAITDSSPVADDWRVGIEARLQALEQRFKARSSSDKATALPKVSKSESAPCEPVQGSFRDAVIALHQSGITSYQQIANVIAEQGLRNSKGNRYGRREVQRVIK